MKMCCFLEKKPPTSSISVACKYKRGRVEKPYSIHYELCIRNIQTSNCRLLTLYHFLPESRMKVIVSLFLPLAKSRWRRKECTPIIIIVEKRVSFNDDSGLAELKAFSKSAGKKEEKYSVPRRTNSTQPLACTQEPENGTVSYWNI